MQLSLPFRISICGRAEVPQYAGSRVTHLISIDDPDDPTPTPRWFSGTHRHLEFHDVERETDVWNLGATAPTRKDVIELLAVAESCRVAVQSEEVHLLVHCIAGVSRSTAAAYSIVAMLIGPGKEEIALKHVTNIRPDAYPNILVVGLADEILDRNGKMIAALKPLRGRFDKAITAWAVAPKTQQEKKKAKQPPANGRSAREGR